MARQCQISGKKRLVGNNVSHANNKTKRVFNVNIRTVRVFSDALKRFFSLKVSAAGQRTLEHKGGLDSWLMAQTPSKLDSTLRKLRTQVEAATKDAK